jgi:hypothetical protein
MLTKFLRVAIFMACVLRAGSAFAGAHYIAANGLDSNNGTSQATPWLHAPGMPNCAGSCASYTPVAGDQFIFRGGDTWHFGNSGASPFTGGTWSWTWIGSNGNSIYVGVDQTWFSGGTWTRPILNGDNPLSTSTTLSSCSYQVGINNQFLLWENLSNVTLDNFEFTGLCEGSTGGSLTNMDHYITYDASAITFTNLYLHGWTHVQFSSGCANANPTFPCFSIYMFRGGTVTGSGTTFQYIVVDGSDSDPTAGGVCYCDGWQVTNSVFRYASQLIPRWSHIWHDNLIEYWYDPGDNASHGNVWESNGDATGTNAYYNNVFRHLSPDNRTQVNIWPWPKVGSTSYWFNNSVYDTHNAGGGNYFDIGQNSNSGDQGTLVIFNNTFEQSQNGNNILQCNSPFGHPFTAANNHYIIDGNSPYSSPCTGGTFVTELAMTHATATGDGYTASQTYAYSPTSSSSPTVGTGTNEQLLCTTLSVAGLSGAAAACQSDTTFAVTYDSTNHMVNPLPARTPMVRLTSQAWDIGAFQAGTQVSGPNPPTNLTVIVQ